MADVSVLGFGDVGEREALVRLFISMTSEERVQQVLDSTPEPFRGRLLALVKSAARAGLDGLAVPGGRPEPGILRLQRESRESILSVVLPAVRAWAAWAAEQERRSPSNGGGKSP